MIHTYVNECQDQPAVEGFLSWKPNNTYHVVRQLLFEVALAIIITETGDRRLHRTVRSLEPYSP